MNAQGESDATVAKVPAGRTWMVRLRQLWLVARFRPFDTSTEAGRAQERYRRALLAAAAALLSRAVTVLTLLVSVPLALHYLEPERYGLWVTISSTVGMFGFADLGLGYGLLNAISNANGRDDREALRRYTSSAMLMLLIVAAAIGVAFVAVYSYVPWARLFNVKTPAAAHETGPAVAAFMLCFLLNVPLGVAQRVQAGFQEGLTANLWQCAASLLSFIALLVGIHLRLGLPALILCMAGGPPIAYALNSFLLFAVQKPWLRPSLSCVRIADAMGLIRLGSMFLILQVVCAMAFTADNFIVDRVLGADAVPRYAIAARLFALPAMLVALTVDPLWPAYGEALARGDVPWIRRTLQRSLTLTASIVLPAALVLILGGKQIIHLWTHDPNVAPTLLLLVGLGAWLILGQIANGLATFYNGMHIVKFQVVISLAGALLNVGLSIYLTRRVGVAGVIWGTVIAHGLLILVPNALYAPKLLKGLEVRRSSSPLPPMA